MKIKLLGAHNCESQNTKLVSLLIDDCLALDAGALTSSLSFAAQQKLKAVLLTHRHFDHIRDIPAIAMNFYLSGTTISIWSTSSVYDALVTHLLDGDLYPAFLGIPQGKPTIKFTTVKPFKSEQIGGYSILAVPVNHSTPAVGYQVTSPDGRTVLYTGDTGPGLAECWKGVSPELLIIEVTAPDRYEDFGREMGHLTPALLKQELAVFRELKGYLPQVVTVHMNPALEKEIEVEIVAVAKELGCSITVGYEGLQLSL